MIGNDDAPLISIVMPVYNVAHYLKDSIGSVFSQTGQNFEFIIINDGSTDDSLSKIEELLSTKCFNNIKVIQTENKGLSAARNLGIKKATGEYLFFLDSDDFLEKDFLETVSYHIISQKSDVIIFNYRNVDESGNKQYRQCSEYTSGIFTSESIMADYLEGNIQNYAWSYVAKRDLYMKSNTLFPVGKVYEDIPVFPRIVYFSKKIQVISDILYNYRQRDQSITREQQTQKIIKYLSDYLSNVEYNREWMLQSLGLKFREKIYTYSMNHYFQIIMIAAQQNSFPYNKLAEVTQCIQRDARNMFLTDLTIKRIVFIYALKLGLGRMCFRIIKSRSRLTT
ncbi:glycosyltransferase family 2 protein [Weissella soli]|uniref:glycosyltransferase family 2 protein n=1 Tax=Weissella soli TaxID=155866 RepID=UPI0011BB81D8|nr:glycosyltransferase family 2 protein [Weissella soli]QEA35202.1 glycosyltransferase [Weissella soli]